MLFKFLATNGGGSGTVDDSGTSSNGGISPSLTVRSNVIVQIHVSSGPCACDLARLLFHPSDDSCPEVSRTAANLALSYVDLSEADTSPSSGGVYGIDCSHPSASALLSSAVPAGRRAYVLSLSIDEPSECPAVVRSMAAMVAEDMKSMEGGEEPSSEIGDECRTEANCTVLEALAGVVFGEAGPPSIPERTGSSRHLAPVLLLCRRPHSPTSTYADRQAQSFLSYHLHKYAAAINASLLFTDGSGVATTVLRSYLSSVALGGGSGASPSVSATLSSDTLLETTEPSTIRLYAPGFHLAPSLLETLRQNASCDGAWDAASDNIDKMQESQQKEDDDTHARPAALSISTAVRGDEDEWLLKLAESVRADMPALADEAVSARCQATPAKPTAPVAAAKPSDTEVSQFFADLIKQK